MADVFVSYAKEDQQAAAIVVSMLESRGLSVWWDERLDPSNSWDRLIEQEIAGAKAVVALWSKASVESEWVRIEANYAKENKKLLQVRLDECSAPLAFSMLQRAELVGWRAGDEHPNWTKLLGWISTLTGRALGPASIEKKTAPTVATETEPGSKHEQYKSWWKPVLDAPFDGAKPVLYYPNNVRIQLTRPKSWLLVTAIDGKDGVAVRLVAIDQGAGFDTKFREDLPILCDVLPDGSAIRQGNKNDVWVETIRPWNSFANDDERRAWLIKTTREYLAVLLPYFEKWSGQT